MRRIRAIFGISILIGVMGSIAAPPARASFIITSAIIEFIAGGPAQADIEVVSRSGDNDYIITEVSEIVHPGAAEESRRALDDPSSAGLIVTPNKAVLPAGGRKLVRFVLMRPPDDKEHIYRVAIKPVVRGVTGTAQVGLKVLVGYEVLVIVRPATPTVAYNAQRHGKVFSVINTGNTNVLFQNGAQCADKDHCQPAPTLRVYPGQAGQVSLPADAAADYTIWDGQATVQKHFD